MRVAGGRRGQAALELALVLPVLLVLTLGTLEWGCFLVRQLTVVHVARDAASAGSRVRPANGPTAYAIGRAQDALAAAGIPAPPGGVTASMGLVTAGPTLDLAVRVPYTPLTGLVPVPRELRAHTTMRMQNK